LLSSNSLESGLVCVAFAQGTYQWPSYRALEQISPRRTVNPTSTYAPCYASLSSLVGDRSTTTWPADPSPTDHEERFGRAALSSLWDPIPVSAPPFSTTVQPTPIPSHELIKPPPLGLGHPQSQLKFPADLQWGFAGAALQIEGAIKDEGRGPSIWEDNFRGNYSQFVNGGPPDIAAMNYYLYKQDIARLAAVGVQSYSFSISWSRIVPFGVAGSPINQQGIDHYNDLINTVLAYGMTPIVTLLHFDTPVYFKSNTSWL
jgi:hypothetical protein